MILPALGTIGTRVLMAFTNLLVVAVGARALGLEGVGIIAMMTLGITFIQLANNVVGGSGLVYLAPRHGSRALRWPAYGWALLIAGGAWLLLRSWQLVPAGYEWATVSIAFLRAIMGIHTNLLLGRERYGLQNTLLLVNVLLMASIYIFLLRHDGSSPMDFVHAAWIADGTTALASGLLLLDREPHLTAQAHPLVDAFSQGSLAQLGNGIQLLNNRYAYYLVEGIKGQASLGLWALTTQLAESAWLMPKSLGTVLYARVSNTEEAMRQRDLSLTVLKSAVGFGACAVAILILTPASLYQFVFGPQVVGVAHFVAWMSPGLLVMSASQALSHFLSGSGRVYHNTIASAIGLLITIVVGEQLILSHGLKGAAITASCAYCCSVIYQVIVFNRLTGARLSHYLPHAGDMERLRTVWNRVVGR